MSEKKNWIVKIRCEVIKEVVCLYCTREQLDECFWDYAESEREIDQVDWKVLEVRENK